MKHCYIIAEAGVNHNGNLKLAKEMIQVAKDVGADAIKFQLFKADALATHAAEQADYQQKNCKMTMSQHAMLKALELSQNDFFELSKIASDLKIDFLITPFDLDSFYFLVHELKLSTIKIGSGDITFGPLLLNAARLGCKIILSTGMSLIDEIEQALKIIALGVNKSLMPDQQTLDSIYQTQEAKAFLKAHVKLLHCVSEYPAPYQDMNLLAMSTLANTFNLPVGLSDHSEGIVIPIAAAAMGACIIEKHFTLDKALEGPDHLASLNPIELREMIRSIRIVEDAMGDGKKLVKDSEMKNRVLVRRSLVAKKDIQQGEKLTLENMAFKRPGQGISPMQYWQFLNQASSRAYEKDEMLI